MIDASAKCKGQIYIPTVNYTLMIATIVVIVGFKTTTNIGNVYGNSLSWNLNF